MTELVSFDSTLALGQTSVKLTYGGQTCTVSGITVAMKDISAIKNLTEENVTSAHKEDILEVKEMIESAVTDLADEDTKAEWSAILSGCETLLDKISSTENKIEALENKVDGYKEDSVKTTDKEALQQIIKDANALINSGNVTEEEKKSLEEAKGKAENLIEVIEKAEETQEETESETESEHESEPERETEKNTSTEKGAETENTAGTEAAVNTAVATGDNSNIETWMLAMAGSLLVLLLLGKKRAYSLKK